MTEYKDLKMKCTSSHPQEPFYTEGKEYDILKNETGFYIKCDEGAILEYGTTPFDLAYNLNQFWDSNFKLVNIDELKNEAEHLFKKCDRFEQQAIKLSKKVRKLNNLIESIKEFE